MRRTSTEAPGAGVTNTKLVAPGAAQERLGPVLADENEARHPGRRAVGEAADDEGVTHHVDRVAQPNAVPLGQHAIEDDLARRLGRGSFRQAPGTAAEGGVVTDQVEGLLLAVQLKHDELGEDRDRALHPVDAADGRRGIGGQERGRPEQVAHPGLGDDERAGGVVEVGRNLAVHAVQEPVEQDDEHEGEGDAGHAEPKAQAIVEEVADGEHHDRVLSGHPRGVPSARRGATLSRTTASRPVRRAARP